MPKLDCLVRFGLGHQVDDLLTRSFGQYPRVIREPLGGRPFRPKTPLDLHLEPVHLDTTLPRLPVEIVAVTGRRCQTRQLATIRAGADAIGLGSYR
jgi:hypothetical protein